MSTSIRALVDAAFARDAGAAPADDPQAIAPAAPRSTPEAEASREVRARRMLSATVKTGDLAPRVEVLMLCVLEALVESADRLAVLERAQREGGSS
jgi:hypothetical protein